MSDAEMHAFLNASCHVERCEIKAQALFDAAVFATPTVWPSVRAELQLDFQASLDLQLALSKAVKQAAKEGKQKTASKKMVDVEVDNDGNPVVNRR